MERVYKLNLLRVDQGQLWAVPEKDSENKDAEHC